LSINVNTLIISNKQRDSVTYDCPNLDLPETQQQKQ